MVVRCRNGHNNRVPDTPKPNETYRCGRPDCRGPIDVIWGPSSVGAENVQGDADAKASVALPVRGSSTAKGLAIVCIILLLLAVVGKWPYGFYVLLRLVICGSAAYLAFAAHSLDKRAWIWLMGATALLFNPVVRIPMARSSWQVVDFVAALVFAASLLFIRDRRWQSSKQLR
jgi:hypothetical protein